MAALAQVTVYAPGSASNLGPGFDCLGVAFTGKGDTVIARRSDVAGVRVIAVSDPRIPCDPERNTAAIAAAAVARHAGAARGGLDLDVRKGLPLAGGMGGSAASAVAGAVAADRLLGTRLGRDDLLLAALEAEAAVSGRHADNVAPSLLGGAVLVAGLDPPVLLPVRMSSSIAIVLVTPAYGVETAAARAVLPERMARGEAVGQAARLAMLVLALERGDGESIRRSMRDGIAEPARASLYPGRVEARRAALEAGAFEVAVSGAGPTLIALAPAGAAGAVSRALVDGYRQAGIEAVSHSAKVDTQGARVIP